MLRDGEEYPALGVTMTMALREEYELLVTRLGEATRATYGPRLVSIVLFGSTARGTPGPESDVDVLIVADPLPAGRLKRVAEFGDIESELDVILRPMREKGLAVSLSPVFKTPEEVKAGSPLFLDMTEDGRILFDRDCFMEVYLQNLRDRLRSLGARRVQYRGAWYWDLKPDYRPGDVIDL
ncbi:MAG: nucleotidyltransferase domain-containing protein [Bacillota bacterium]